MYSKSFVSVRGRRRSILKITNYNKLFKRDQHTMIDNEVLKKLQENGHYPRISGMIQMLAYLLRKL